MTPEIHGHGAAASRIASAFLAKLEGRYDVAEAILFGSRARGDHHADSDLDLAVVLKGERRDFIGTKLTARSPPPRSAWRAGWPIRRAIRGTRCDNMRWARSACCSPGERWFESTRNYIPSMQGRIA